MPKPTALRVLLGIAAVAVALAIVILALSAYRGSFTRTVGLTVIASPRAGSRDGQRRQGQSARCAGRSGLLDRGPARRTGCDPPRRTRISWPRFRQCRRRHPSPTVFGAKSVNLVPPADLSGHALRPGQVLDTDHVTVEFNTIFEQLSVGLSQIQPDKLNETLSAPHRPSTAAGASSVRRWINPIGTWRSSSRRCPACAATRRTPSPWWPTPTPTPPRISSRSPTTPRPLATPCSRNART